MKYFISFLIFKLMFFFTDTVYAQNEHFQKTKLGTYYALYSGEKNTSFSNGANSFGFEGSMETQGAIVSIYTKGRILSSAGRQTFLDGSTEITSSYTFYQTQLELGGHLYLVPRRRKGINVYLGAGGILGYSHLALSSANTTLSSLKKVDQSLTTGASGHVGMEWIINYQSPRKWTLSSEVGYAVENANLAGTNQFKLNSFYISLGLGW